MFHQIPDPVFGSLVLSAVVATLPLAVLFALLGVARVRAWTASLVALVLSAALAIFVWRMPPLQALSSMAEGALHGIVPILWILVNALWVYQLTVQTGWFAVLGERIRVVSRDERVLAIVIAFCFGALLESLAGFGAPVAISVGMLIAAGMKPLKAAIVSLLANTAPVAFGAMAAPIIALAGVTGIDTHALSQMAGRQTPFLAVLVPLILVVIVDGIRGLKETWAVAVVAGLAFAISQFVTANFIAVEITDVVASIVTLLVVLVVLRFWKPASSDSSGAAGSAAGGAADESSGEVNIERTTLGATPKAGRGVAGDRSEWSRTRLTWYAVLPYVVIVTIFAVSQVPSVKEFLSRATTVALPWPGLDITDSAGTPVPTVFSVNIVGNGGTLLLLAGMIVACVYRVSFRGALAAYGATLRQLRFTIITVMTVLALAYVMNLSGQTQSLGAALATTGALFALLSPTIGWVGVAITGSDTSSNALFGMLQVTAAEKAGLSPVLMAATNSSAGVLGKMLSPQNLAVAAAAAGMVGKEGELFRKLLWWSLGLLLVFTGLVCLQSTVLAWMVPAV